MIPHTLVTEYAIDQTEKSGAGVCYASATGEPIPNLGEQKLPLASVEGSLRAMTFQVAPVAKPLGSVQRICAAGHTVVFDSEGSYIRNKQTGELNWMRNDNGNFIADRVAVGDYGSLSEYNQLNFIALTLLMSSQTLPVFRHGSLRRTME